MAKILIIDDDPYIRILLEEITVELGFEPISSGNLEEGFTMAASSSYDLILLDLDFPEGNGLTILPDLLNLPTAPEVIIITGTGDTKGAEIAFNYGAWDYVRKPFLSTEISLPIVRALQYHEEKAAAKKKSVLKRDNIVGNSAVIQASLEEMARAASTDSNVIIYGETGTGKELFAKAIHENSKRAEKNFVVIDCGSLPETLVESILFGHVKGAFTGATVEKEGLILQANGGTLFMDEIGELPLSIQKTLLRALQEHRIRPVGGRKEIEVDFRLVAATNRNLEEMAVEKTFRSDLLFRLNGIEISLPPLRERLDDLDDILYHKIQQQRKLFGRDMKGVSAAYLETLKHYAWPGNIRELINVIEHSLVNAGEDPTLVPVHLPPRYRAALLAKNIKSEKMPSQSVAHRSSPPALETSVSVNASWSDYRLAMEKQYLLFLQTQSKGSWKTACQLSGLSKTRLYELLKKHNLSLAV